MVCKKCNNEIDDASVFCNFCGKKQKITTAQTIQTKPRDYGSGSIYKRSNGKYVASIVLGYDENKNAVRKSKSNFATKKEAEKWIANEKNKTEENQSRTVESLWDTYSNGVMQRITKSSQNRYRAAYKKLDDIKLLDIRGVNLDQIQIAVNKCKSYPLAKDVKYLMSYFFEIAKSEGVLSYNPTKYLLLPENNVQERKPFTLEDVNKMWQAYNSGEFFCGYMLLMCYSGMMPSELFNIEKDMIDLKCHTISGAGMKTKTRKETPIVMCDTIIPVVEKLMELSDKKLWPHGRKMFYKNFEDVVKKYGLSNLTPYSCRHTTAYMLGQLEINDSTIKKIMRHNTMKMTEYYMAKGVSEVFTAFNKMSRV